jgi:hypothetical protein
MADLDHAQPRHAARDPPVDLLADAEAEQRGGDRRQHRYPAGAGVGLAWEDDPDRAPRAGRDVLVGHLAVHGDHVGGHVALGDDGRAA